MAKSGKNVPYFTGVERVFELALCLDPGPEDTGVILLDRHWGIHFSGKMDNGSLLHMIIHKTFQTECLVQEMLIPFPGAGKSLSDTLVWLGRFEQAFRMSYKDSFSIPVETFKILRTTVRSFFVPKKKENRTDLPKTKDAIVRKILIERYMEKRGIDVTETDNLTRDAWQALALGIYFMHHVDEFRRTTLAYVFAEEEKRKS